MLRKRQRKPNTSTSFSNTMEAFHLVFSVASIVALIITTLIGKDIHLVIELILIFIVTAVNFYILLRKRETEEGEELSLFYTFWTNKLRPSRSGGEQTYKVTIAFIEDEEEAYFRDDVQKRFKTEVNLEELKGLLSKESKLKSPILKEQNLENLIFEEVKDRNLYFHPINIASLNKDDVEQLKKDFKKRLNSDLEKPTAVIVVRTGKLEDKPWVYETVVSWAYEHSEIPILFAKDPEQNFPENKIAKKFLSIPNDSKSLPWRLLQRAKNRAKVWRIQAAYNRAMLWNIFYVSLICIYMGAIGIKAKDKQHSTQIKAKDEQLSSQTKAKDEQLSTQKSNYLNTMNGIEEALQTEKAYRVNSSKKDDAKLSVSYWYGFMDKPYIFVTTESPHNTTNFEKNYETIIGCGFVEPNHIIEGSVKTNKAGKKEVKVVAYNYYGHIVPMPKCQLRELKTSAIKSIVCATYNDLDDPLITKRTVGICVFTEDESNEIFSEEGRIFLIETTKKLHTDHINSLENNNVISLAEAERQRKTLPAH